MENSIAFLDLYLMCTKYFAESRPCCSGWRASPGVVRRRPTSGCGVGRGHSQVRARALHPESAEPRLGGAEMAISWNVSCSCTMQSIDVAILTVSAGALPQIKHCITQHITCTHQLPHSTRRALTATIRLRGRLSMRLLTHTHRRHRSPHALTHASTHTHVRTAPDAHAHVQHSS